jgi:hypothetical protein
MKRSPLLLTALLLVSLASATQVLAHPRTPRLNGREQRIERRIHQGARSGELTRPEAMRLRGGLCRLHGRAARFKADGHLSIRERHALHHQAHHLSREVYRLKHNGRHRF